MAQEEAPYIVEDRRMLSRVVGDRIRITHTIEPGKRSTGCLICCNAPPSCPLCGCFVPCCDYPEYSVNEMNASKYIYVRENGLEWNNPKLQLAKGSCCGSSLTELVVMDDVTVLYFDDVYFDNVRNDTRMCNNLRTFCCGGRGEQVQIESPCCCGCCLRGRTPMTCIPSCCPEACCPCVAKSELWVEDADAAVTVIKNAQQSAITRLQIQR